MVTIFRHIELGCHGEEKKCLHVNGKHMPVCARCTGTIIGHCGAILSVFFISYTEYIYFLSAGFLLIMFADWWMQNNRKWYHSNFTRLITGIMGGFAVAVCIVSIIVKTVLSV